MRWKALIFLLLLVGSVAFMIFAWIFLCNEAETMYKDNTNKYESKLGKKILFEKDSVTIVDFSRFDETFTLSNGKKINEKLVK